MALLITLFLVLINIFNNITTNSPKAEGLTAIEIWMLACILFVFGEIKYWEIVGYGLKNFLMWGGRGVNKFHKFLYKFVKISQNLHQKMYFFSPTPQRGGGDGESIPQLVNGFD